MPESGPSPHGEGGLKFRHGFAGMAGVASLPTRGGWIEISLLLGNSGEGVGPSPHGEGGLKYFFVVHLFHLTGPSPHGEGGLKFLGGLSGSSHTGVPPPTGRVD